MIYDLPNIETVLACQSQAVSSNDVAAYRKGVLGL
jgi:hypothetical protein